ncbi:MAG: NAD(+)/NADH kinase [Thermomicrobiales bacterium]
MESTSAVGIIANPASGKDIRRLVAHGSTFDNNEKINIIRRILLALESLGISEVFYMPDTYGIVPRAQTQAKTDLHLNALPMPVFGNAGDSLEAAQRLRDLNVACIVTLGGDGTNRVVARGNGAIPLIPISTGTNNVFPRMIEGTLAGMAAAVVARGLGDDALHQRPKLEVHVDGRWVDIALVDVVLSHQPWIGSRAFWRADQIREVVLSHRPTSAIGICSLASILLHAESENTGLHATVGEPGRNVLVPIAPGILADLPVSGWQPLRFGETVTFQPMAGTIALDGEREIELRGDEIVEVALCSNGPVVVDIDRAIAAGIVGGVFSR